MEESSKKREHKQEKRSPICHDSVKRRQNLTRIDIIGGELRSSHEVATKRDRVDRVIQVQHPQVSWGWSRAQIRWWGRASIVVVVLGYYGWNLKLGHTWIAIGSLDYKNGDSTRILSKFKRLGSQDKKVVHALKGDGNTTNAIQHETKPRDLERTTYADNILEIVDVTTEVVDFKDALPKGFRLRSAWGSEGEATKAFLSVIDQLNHPTPILKKNSTQPLIHTLFPFHPDWHPLSRKERFPSVEDRVAIYVGEEYWLDKACKNTYPLIIEDGGTSVDKSRDRQKIVKRHTYISFANGTVIIPSHMIRREADVSKAISLSAEEIQQAQVDSTTEFIPRFRGGLRSFTMFPATQSSTAIEEASRWLHPLSDIMDFSEREQNGGNANQNDLADSAITVSPNPRTNRTEPNSVLSLRRHEMTQCANNNKHMYYKYCQDALTLLDTAEELLDLETATGTGASDLSEKDQTWFDTAPPILVRFSDSEEKWKTKSGEVVDVPIFKKFRNILPSDESIKVRWNKRQQHQHDSPTSLSEGNANNSAFRRLCSERSNFDSDSNVVLSTTTPREWEPFIWNLNSHRHYRHVPRIPYIDRPWYMKRNAAVWRGAMSGREAIRHKAVETIEECHLVPRCRLVLAHLDKLSEVETAQMQRLSDDHETKPDVTQLTKQVLVDAKFATCVSGKDKLVGAKPIDTHPMFTTPCSNRLEVKEMLEYKVIIMLEGNDVASGLKWALFSQSVVLMPKPTRMTWAMETWLEPWIHYVPVDDDLSNVEERVQWILDHEQDAKRIAERATLFMYDLLYHPQVKEEDEEVKQELLKLYWATFQN